MCSITKVVISTGEKLFNIELAFNLLQRKVFSDNKLNLYVLTFEVEAMKPMAEHIENCCFSNMNEIIVTECYQKAFWNADYLLLHTNSTKPECKFDENNIRHLNDVFEKPIDNCEMILVDREVLEESDLTLLLVKAIRLKKAKLFDHWANADARVLIMGPRSNTWLQVFGEVAMNLSKYNFTGLSRHYVSKVKSLIARKLDCEPQQLSGLNVWGEYFLDLTNCRRKHPNSGPHNGTSDENVMELLPSDWIDNLLKRQCSLTKINSVSVCRHLLEWRHGTGGRTSCMAICAKRSGQIDDGIYSLYPVIVDEHGNIFMIHNVCMESLLFQTLYRYYEEQQKQKYLIRCFLDDTNENLTS